MSDLEQGSTAPPRSGQKACTCGAAMVFVETIFGKRIPLDVEPDPEKGNIIVVNDCAIYIAGPDRQAEARPVALKHGLKLYTTHFATCPEADRHRKGS